jgi:hypothetical protein
MRKVLLLNVLALSLFSCAVEDSATKATTSISAVVTTEAKASSLTSKDVKRGNIYAWVKEITLTATSNETGQVSGEAFNLVPNNTANATDVFKLDNVAVGSNTIAATSTTSTVGELSLLVAKGTPSTVVAEAVAKNPYAVYASTPIVKVISETDNNVITIPMNTKNGRVIGAFAVNDDNLLRGYEVWVEALVNNVSIQKVRIQAGDVAKFYFSDATAVAGAVVKYKVTFVNIKSQVLFDTLTEQITVEASTSYSCKYVVTPDRKLTKDDNRFTFVFQKWNETTCPTCGN